MSTSTDQIARRTVGQATSWVGERLRAILAGFRRHRIIYAIALGSYVASLVESRLVGDRVELALTGILSTSLLVVLAGVVCWELLLELGRLWRSGHPGSPTLALLRALLHDILTPGRFANGFHASLAMGFFAIGFTTLKSNIPKVNPFSWDDAFIHLDRVLHFGMLPHELLAPVLQYPLATLALNATYNLWFFFMLGFFLWQGFQGKDTRLRQRFLIAYMLCWVLGTPLLGTIFSSAGPCFYGRLFPGPDPYAGLMTYLRQVNETYPIWALGTQDMLYDAYTSKEGPISGISAMPSMHVTTSVLFFLCARASGIRWLSWITGVFAAAIMLGSVLLAWHYAVDGYAGVLIALACWSFAGWLTRRIGLSSRPS